MFEEGTINVMVDLETLGTGPDAAVIAIGARTFGVSLPEEFYARISPTDAERFGSVDKETMLWWDKVENKQARAEAFGGTEKTTTVLYNFGAWLETLGTGEEEGLDHLYVWSNGADFDLPILKNLMLEATGDYPINFRNHRCYRTLKSLVAPSVYADISNPFAHNALEDARYQALVAQRIITTLCIM